MRLARKFLDAMRRRVVEVVVEDPGLVPVLEAMEGLTVVAVGQKAVSVAPAAMAHAGQFVLFGPVQLVVSHLLAWGHHELVHSN